MILTLRQPLLTQEDGESPDEEGAVISVVGDVYVANSRGLSNIFRGKNRSLMGRRTPPIRITYPWLKLRLLLS
jgi:hypothetical protein